MENISESSGRIAYLVQMVGQPRIYLGLVLVALVAAVPLFASGYILHVFILMFILGSGAVAWNLVGGYGGLFALGNMVFFGIGGYTIAVLMVTHEWGLLPSAAVALMLSLATAYIIGYATFNLSGHYFALATLAIVEGVWYMAGYARNITNGYAGFSVVPAMSREPILSLSRNEYFYLAYGLFTLAFVVVAAIRYTKPGYYLMALRDDQVAASSLGINVFRYKMFAWLVTAFLTAVAGIVYTVYLQFITPEFMFSLDNSVLLAIIVIIGGRATLTGPVLGILLLIPLQQIATTQFGGEIGALTYVVYGIVLILLITFAPEGLVQRLSIADRVDNLPTFSGSSEGRRDLPWD